MNIYNQFKAILVLTVFASPCFADGMQVVRENYGNRATTYNKNVENIKIPEYTNNINNVLKNRPLERVATSKEKEDIVKDQFATTLIHGPNKKIEYSSDQLTGQNEKHFRSLNLIQKISHTMITSIYENKVTPSQALDYITEKHRSAATFLSYIEMIKELSNLSKENLKTWFNDVLTEHAIGLEKPNPRYWHDKPDVPGNTSPQNNVIPSSSRPPAGPILNLEDFGWTPQIKQTIGTLTANPDIQSIMSIYDPSKNSYGEFSEVGMKLAFIEWEASQLGKPRMGFLGTNVGYFQFALNGIPTNNTIPGQKHHNTLQTFYGNANDAFKKGFNSYAGVVRTSGSSGGHYFTLFATKSASGWDVAAINPLGMPGSKDSAAKEALNPFVEFLKSKGETVHSQQAIAAGLQAGNSTCGFWATIMARALCSEGSLSGLENLYNWLMQQASPSPKNLETIGSAPAQAIILAQITVLKETTSLQDDVKNLTVAISATTNPNEIKNGQDQLADLQKQLREKQAVLAQNQVGIRAKQIELERKLHIFEGNFANYFITLMQVLVNKSMDSGYNKIADPHHRTGTTQAQLNQYDEHIVTPACKELHKNFVEAIKQNVYTTK